jgi:hypothetical protein
MSPCVRFSLSQGIERDEDACGDERKRRGKIFYQRKD